MRRREFITLLGGMAIAWPGAAWAQQPMMPVIGFLGTNIGPSRPPAFLQALREGGYVEGRNVEFDFRWGPYEQLPALAAELVRRRVAVIRAGGPPAFAGGLMSYGTDDVERERQMGLYIARILKGDKPADLPGSAWEFAYMAAAFRQGLSAPPPQPPTWSRYSASCRFRCRTSLGTHLDGSRALAKLRTR